MRVPLRATVGAVTSALILQIALSVLIILTLAPSSAPAQMHKVAKPQQVVRAVGVYEWTGDFAKPTASRLIPVSLFIESKFEDAGIYIARPVPFALLSGNLYILQNAGVDKGTLDLVYAKHLQAVESTGDLAYDDGWFGYGSVRPLAAPRKTTTALKPSKNLPVITAANDTNRPHFGSKPGADTTPAATTGDQTKPAATQTTSKPDTTTSSTTSTSDDPDRPTMKRRNPDSTNSGTSTTADPNSTTTSTATPADDPDRPTMKRRNPDTTASGSTTTGSDTTSTAPTTTSTTSSPASTSPDDPDRPTMKRRSPDSTASGTDTTASTTSTAPDTADDPDRPTLKRHTPADNHKANSGGNDSASVSGTGGSLNDDPSRPNLHHGKPASAMTETDLPKLAGLPPNLHQMVAVSDAVNRDPHPFTLDWDDEAQHQAILQKMQTMARAQLAAYATNPAASPAAKPPATTPAVKKTAPTSTTRPRRTAAPPAPQQPLLDEELKAYTLSYGGAATYVYSANTGGTGAALRYVTIVAQDDGLGNIKPAIQSVTDAAHLNRSPKMQFVDVVDADASNRASLLFELRSQNARQFALYRVIASHPDQIFLTGTTQ
jgi:hypothetical protein